MTEDNTDDISGTDGGCQCGCQCGKRGYISLSAALGAGFLAECAFQCIAKVTPCKKSGAHSQEDTGSDQQDQHHRSPDKVINSGNNFFIKYFEDLQS